MRALDAVRDWPVDTAAVAVLDSGGGDPSAGFAAVPDTCTRPPTTTARE